MYRMNQITIDNKTYLTSDREPKLFDAVICPKVVNGNWDKKTYYATILNSELMCLLPEEMSKVKSIIASHELLKTRN